MQINYFIVEIRLNSYKIFHEIQYIICSVFEENLML